MGPHRSAPVCVATALRGLDDPRNHRASILPIVLAEGSITKADILRVELHQPIGSPAFVLLVWPAAPTVTNANPKAIATIAATSLRIMAEYKALRREIFYRLKFSGGELTQDLKVRMARMDEIIDVDLERLRTEAIDVLGADVIEIDNKLSKLEESLGGS